MWIFPKDSSKSNFEEDAPDFRSHAWRALGTTGPRYTDRTTSCSRARFGTCAQATSCREWYLARALMAWKKMHDCSRGWTSIRHSVRRSIVSVARRSSVIRLPRLERDIRSEEHTS